MATPTNIAIITHPGAFPGEADLLASMLEEGAHHVLIRKPEAGSAPAWVLHEALSSYGERVVMHHQHGVREGVGVHAPFGFAGVSTSCHSKLEAEEAEEFYPRYYLSPVCDSISKPGYSANENLDGMDFPKAFALGGVSLQTLSLVREKGFSSITLMGALWQNDSPLDEYLRISQAWRS